MLARPVALDPLLLPFVDAADDDRARDLLGDLLIAHASPVVRHIIQRHLSSGGSRAQDAEDLHAAVLLRLTAQLWTLRTGEPDASIANLAGYAATAAYNACHGWLRAQAPRRARLQSRLRYVLTRDPRLALREAASREWWCGTRVVCDQPDAASDEDVRGAVVEQLARVREETRGDDAAHD
jgi:DNA-directed RNA polymerase specialized sigma24 family protein